MNFCSQEFLVFFAVVFSVYWAIRARWVCPLLLVVIAAYYRFFGAWRPLIDGLAVNWQTVRSASNWQSLSRALESFVAVPQRADWMAAIVGVTALLVWRIGADRARVWLLLLSSFFFYACWNQWLALLICISTVIDYAIGKGLDHFQTSSGRKALLVTSLVGNLGLLCYFKYANFFLHSLQRALEAAGSAASLPVLSVILPVGITFYTFEAINYTVDVYRKRAPAERSLPNFMLFITFFPHLVAGPIVRARDFLPQIRRRKDWDWARMQLGVQYVLMGVFKKLAIADRMAIYAEPIFQNPGAYNTSATWTAVFAYALQIYCDFSGYSDIALGTAHMLGYKLAQNFNMPYLAVNISEFWHRWHMSLSTWLRDYLFIPLGGSRGSATQTGCNLMFTMALGGLWHGANWTFVAWGILHGGLLIGHRAFREFCKTRPWLDRVLQSGPGTVFRVSLTFLAVCIGWVFFRSLSFSDAATILKHLFSPQAGLSTSSILNIGNLVVTAIVVALCHVLVHFGVWKKWNVRVPAPALGFSYAMVLTLALVLAPLAGKAFIYFQF